MKRTNKKERENNAKNFYQLFNNYSQNRQCIVVERNNNRRVQFVVCNFSNPIIIAESNNLGVEGCWIDFINNIKGGIKQVTYYEDDFKNWLKETINFNITYYDGLVFIIEKC